MIVGIINWIFSDGYMSGRYADIMLKEVYNNTENIDTLFLGTSHVMYGYDIEVINRMLDVNAYNAGSSAQPMITSYYLLKEIDKMNNIDTVYLEASFYTNTDYEQSAGDINIYIVSDAMKWSANKWEYLYNVSGTQTFLNGVFCTARRNIPLFKLEVKQVGKIEPGDYTRLNDINKNVEYAGKGFVRNYGKIDDEFDFQTEAEKYNLTSEKPMSNSSYTWLIKIIEYCENSNIELVLVNVPMPDEFLSRVRGYSNYADFLYTLAKRENITYLDFNLYEGYEKSLNDFADFHHLNIEGAQKFAEIFCRTIKTIGNSKK